MLCSLLSVLILVVMVTVNIEGTRLGHHPYKRENTAPTVGNRCPESSPWPCKTPNHCLSFDLICDGEEDCPDKYDEDPKLCIAKDRPAHAVLSQFIENYRDWLVPDYLGAGSSEELAQNLIESKSIQQYSEMMKLTPNQAENLQNMMDAVKNQRSMDLLLMGMPPDAWGELYFLFKRIIDTGFMGE